MPVAGVVQMRDRLDRYTLVERIGRGGMAEVFRARVQSLGGFERDVAVKVLLPQFANEPEFVDMLLDEARIAGTIVHPCVVQVIDVGRQGEIFYIVMEYVRRARSRGRLRAACPVDAAAADGAVRRRRGAARPARGALAPSTIAASRGASCIATSRRRT